MPARSAEVDDAPAETPETRYTQAPDGAYSAFQVFGAGSIDILLMPGYFTNIDENWRMHPIADVLRRIGSSRE